MCILIKKGRERTLKCIITEFRIRFLNGSDFQKSRLLASRVVRRRRRVDRERGPCGRGEPPPPLCNWTANTHGPRATALDQSNEQSGSPGVAGPARARRCQQAAGAAAAAAADSAFIPNGPSYLLLLVRKRVLCRITSALPILPFQTVILRFNTCLLSCVCALSVCVCVCAALDPPKKPAPSQPNDAAAESVNHINQINQIKLARASRAHLRAPIHPNGDRRRLSGLEGKVEVAGAHAEDPLHRVDQLEDQEELRVCFGGGCCVGVRV